MTVSSALLRTILLGTVFMFLAVPVFGQRDDVKTSLFKDVDSVMTMAKNADAEILTPKNFGEARSLYIEASNDFQKGKNLDDIRKKINRSVSIFQQCLESTKLAKVTFATNLGDRSDALSAESPNFAPRTWADAELKFREAATKLEDGDVKSAQRKAREASDMYRAAELEAIRTAYLTETWNLLKQAKKMKVGDEAPKTLANAEELLNRAEAGLAKDRYDTDLPRSLAQQAKHQAQHAIYLSNTIRQLKKDKQSFEDVFLMSEEPLRAIASNLDMAVYFDEGMDKVTGQIVESISHLQDSSSRLGQNLTDKNQELANLDGRVKELQQQLGDYNLEKTALTEEMEAQAMIRQKFATVEKAFDPEEARVLREGKDVIVRLTGLTFNVGKSDIEPQYFGLLTKVRQSISLFPGSKVTVQGHTDSYGSDETNTILSQHRANSIRSYLMANMNLNDSQIEAVGLGETRPIASNETPEGRSKNRRIDIVIHPQ